RVIRLLWCRLFLFWGRCLRIVTLVLRWGRLWCWGWLSGISLICSIAIVIWCWGWCRLIAAILTRIRLRCRCWLLCAAVIAAVVSIFIFRTCIRCWLIGAVIACVRLWCWLIVAVIAWVRLWCWLIVAVIAWVRLWCWLIVAVIAWIRCR